MTVSQTARRRNLRRSLIHSLLIATSALPLGRWADAEEQAKRPSKPTLQIEPYDGKKHVRLERPSTEGKRELRKTGDGFQLHDLVAKKPVGKPLPWKHHDPREWASQTMQCWALSPDGRYLAVGFGFREVSRGIDRLVTSLGMVHVWEVKTGEEISTNGIRLGVVHEIWFAPDGKTVVVKAEKREIDGP